MNPLEGTEHRAYALALDLAQESMAMIVDQVDHPENVRQKGEPSDWVTSCDEAIEANIRTRILKEFPDHRVVGEEVGSTGDKRAEYVWYVDPIDGTCNFAHGLRWSSSTLALLRNGTPVVGVMVHPYLGETYHAWRGHGAWINRVALKTAIAAEWPGSILMTELANHAYWPGMPELLDWMAQNWVTARIMGSSALGIVQVALGRAQAAVVGQASPIDHGAAVLIAEEAGYAVRGETSSGGGFPEGRLIVAHPARLEELSRIVFDVITRK